MKQMVPWKYPSVSADGRRLRNQTDRLNQGSIAILTPNPETPALPQLLICEVVVASPDRLTQRVGLAAADGCRWWVEGRGVASLSSVNLQVHERYVQYPVTLRNISFTLSSSRGEAAAFPYLKDTAS